LDLELGLDLRPAASSGRISDTCDYDRVADQVRELLQFRRYRIIEVAAEELAAMLFGLNDKIETLRVRLEKPRALEGRARAGAVEILRERADFPRRVEKTRFGEVEILHEGREAGLYLLHVDAGGEIVPHRHAVMRELEWLVTGDLQRNGQVMAGPEPTAWSVGRVHGYRNLGDTRATLFCCDTPPFIPDDEIEVPAAEVTW
jgi:dihydroneopterin aldolase